MQQRVFSAAGAARGPRIQRETPGAQGRQALFAASSAAQPAQGAPGAGLSRTLCGSAGAGLRCRGPRFCGAGWRERALQRKGRGLAPALL